MSKDLETMLKESSKLEQRIANGENAKKEAAAGKQEIFKLESETIANHEWDEKSVVFILNELLSQTKASEVDEITVTVNVKSPSMLERYNKKYRQNVSHSDNGASLKFSLAEIMNVNNRDVRLLLSLFCDGVVRFNKKQQKTNANNRLAGNIPKNAELPSPKTSFEK